MFCWRCGKPLNKNYHVMILMDGTPVPVCRDDYMCPESIRGSRVKLNLKRKKTTK
ncbi:hypothetical protein [Pectinatus frisingensis]|uniref:hypothetical protein n=1 Tax=Pectinatus frisingensis TaxID=865 RepID=UPI0018C5080F|nr:hypothetical protein [Pectinatus frisingensis]